MYPQNKVPKRSSIVCAELEVALKYRSQRTGFTVALGNYSPEQSSERVGVYAAG